MNPIQETHVTATSIHEVPAGTYNVDPVHSTFGFAIRHSGISTFHGQFERVDATLKDGVLTGTAQVDSIKTAIPELKGHLARPDFFDAEQTPTVSFRSTDIRIADGGSVEVDGELTIRNATRAVTATGTMATGENIRGDETVGFDLDAELDRREYGLAWQAQLPRGGDVLAWDVVLEVHLELGKA
jgi:polyisoprenoid-binding protein YceI